MNVEVSTMKNTVKFEVIILRTREYIHKVLEFNP